MKKGSWREAEFFFEDSEDGVIDLERLLDERFDRQLHAIIHCGLICTVHNCRVCKGIILRDVDELNGIGCPVFVTCIETFCFISGNAWFKRVR